MENESNQQESVNTPQDKVKSATSSEKDNCIVSTASKTNPESEAQKIIYDGISVFTETPKSTKKVT